jgi:hypothetical protein
MLIDLNFLPLNTSEFAVPIFRSSSKFNGEPREDGYFAAQLPVSQELGREHIAAMYCRSRKAAQSGAAATGLFFV